MSRQRLLWNISTSFLTAYFNLDFEVYNCFYVSLFGLDLSVVWTDSTC